MKQLHRYRLEAPVAIAFMAFSTLASYDQQQKAAKAQRDANALQQRKADNEAQQARIAQMREARIRRAQLLAGAGGMGGGSSGLSGAQASVTSQMASNIGLINQTQYFANEISAKNQQAADHASRAQTYSSVADLAFKAYSIKAGPKSTDPTKPS